MFLLCLYVCLYVGLILEVVDTKTSFLVWWYILTISMSSSSVKVIELLSKSKSENCLFIYWDISLTCFYMSKVKFIN